MHKIRISEIAKELGLKSKEVIEKAKEINIDVKSPSSGVEEETAQVLYNYIVKGETPVDTEHSESQHEEPKYEEPKQRPQEIAHKEEQQPVEMLKEPDIVEQKEVQIVQQEVAIEPQSAPVAEPVEVKETLASATIQKRRQIVIVKKRRESEPEKVEQAKEPESGIQEAPKHKEELTDDDLTAHLRKKKKVKKHQPVTSRKEAEQKLEFIERDLGDNVEVDESEREVQLLDFHMNETKIEEEDEAEKKRKILENSKIKIAKKTPFFDQGIRRMGRRKPKRKIEVTKEEVHGDIEIPEDIRVYEFADKVGRSVAEVIKALFSLGKMITKNDFLDKDDIEILAAEFDVQVKTKNMLDELDYVGDYELDEDEEKHLFNRPPVVTIMGHVDHGKTSLLDKIRNSRVAAGEAGGITQHIGAYMVEKNGKKISFIDTPGHEAFTEMRARGAQVTDIAIIVVAADDGVQPQTREALNHAKAAGVPIIIAVNKIDKPEANPDKVKSQMADLGFTAVDWGGEYEFVHISAKVGTGIDDLLETILIQSEILDLKANPDRSAKGVVIESSLEKGKGSVATVIIQNGTLKVGDSVVVDTTYGRVRALIDDFGRNIKQIGPSEMAVVTGLNDVPSAGSVLISVEDDAEARDIAYRRAEHARQKSLSKSTKVSIDELSEMVAKGALKVLNVLIKSDVQGSLEAIKGSLEKIKNEEVRVNVVHMAVGGITESDVSLAGASENGIILGFNIRPTGTVKDKAKALGVQIKSYSIIYDLIDDIKSILGGMMSPVFEEEATGQAEVRDTFVVPKMGTVAGCFVVDGSINRGIKARVIRDGVILFTGNISSLRRFKDDVREVAKGFECGIMIDGYNDVKPGDVLETFKEVERKRAV